MHRCPVASKQTVGNKIYLMGFYVHTTVVCHGFVLYCPVCAQVDQWVTQGGTDPLPLEEEHCSVVEVTEEDIQNSVKFVPSLSAVVRITLS